MYYGMNNFPYTNLHELNLDWIIRTMRDTADKLDNFVGLNTIKYADPIQWSITSQYPQNMIVIDPGTGTAYISVKAVPSGVELKNTDYWSVVFDLGSFYGSFKSGISTDMGSDETISAALPEGALVWYKNNLYETSAALPAGAKILPGVNVEKITIEDWAKTLNEDLSQRVQDNHDDINTEIVDREAADTEIRGLIEAETHAREEAVKALGAPGYYYNVKAFGAKGDGTTDDTEAFRSAFAAGSPVVIPAGTYLITDHLNIPSNMKILGYDAVITGTTCPFIFGILSQDYATGYNGVHDVYLRGVTIDMQNATTDCLIMAHAKDIVVENCHFKNNKEHAIELNSSYNVTIRACTFTNIAPGIANKEAINIDTATQSGAPSIGAWDNTVSQYVIIDGCVFDNCFGAAGNHNTIEYASKNIIFTNNNVTNCAKGFIAFSYTDITITGCVFDTLSDYGIQMSAVTNMKVDDCTFANIASFAISGLNSTMQANNCTFKEITANQTINCNKSTFIFTNIVEVDATPNNAFCSVSSPYYVSIANSKVVSSTTNVILDGKMRSTVGSSTDTATFSLPVSASIREAIVIVGATGTFKPIYFSSISIITGTVIGSDGTSSLTLNSDGSYTVSSSGNNIRCMYGIL